MPLCPLLLLLLALLAWRLICRYGTRASPPRPVVSSTAVGLKSQ